MFIGYYNNYFSDFTGCDLVLIVIYLSMFVKPFSNLCLYDKSSSKYSYSCSLFAQCPFNSMKSCTVQLLMHEHEHMYQHGIINECLNRLLPSLRVNHLPGHAHSTQLCKPLHNKLYRTVCSDSFLEP